MFTIMINPVVMNLFDFMIFLVDYNTVCVLLRQSSSRTRIILLLKKNISTNIDCFVVDSSHLHLTFGIVCCLSVVFKQ